MAGSGKKGKGKASSNKKNKKGKSQETSETPASQSDLPAEQEEQQQDQQQPESPTDVHPQQTEAEPISDSLPESAPELESTVGPEPEPVPAASEESASAPGLGLEQPEPAVEATSAAEETEKPSQSPVDVDDGDFAQFVTSPDPTSQPPGENDAQNDTFKAPANTNLEDLDPWEAPVERVEANQENNDDFLDGQSGTAEPTETPVTAPQSPVIPSAPISVPLQSPSLTEAQATAVSPHSNAAPLESESHIFAQSNPFSEPTVTSTVHQTTTPASKPGSPTPEFVSLPVQPTSSESQVASPPPEGASSAFKPALPQAQAVSTPRGISHAPEFTSSVFKPSSPEPQFSSPPPEAASPTSKSASPEPQTEPEQHATWPLSHRASPVPQTASASPQQAASAMAQPAPPNPESAFPMEMAASSPAQISSPIYHQASPMAQPSSPLQKTISPIMKATSPVQKIASPKISSPLARAVYMSPVMSPHGTPPQPPPPAPTAPPSVAPSFATAYHSPIMSSAGYLPQYAYYSHPSPHTQPTPRGSMDPNSAGSFQALRDLGFANGNGVNEKGTVSPPEHDEPIELLQRIQDAIPDINRLLGSYKNTKGKLQAREVEFKQIASQHEQALMHKDFYIEALQNQMRKTANESAEESSRLKNTINELRMELGNLEDKRKDIEERLEDSEKANEEISKSKIDLEGQVKTLNTDIQEAQEAHEKELERQKEEKAEALATQKQELTELFEEIKAEDEKAAAETLAAREKELLDQQESMQAEHEKEKAQMQESYSTLQSEFDTKVKELDSTKTELDNKQKELEESREQHAKEVEDLRQTHASEVEDLQQTHANEMESLNRNHEEKVAEMESQFSEKEQHWADEKTDLEKQLSDKCEELTNCEHEIKKLEEASVVKEKQLQHAVEGMRVTIDNLDNDCDRLRKTLHSLGEATDLKSTKGDSFFLDCFGQLSRLIVSLSKEHFAYLPIDPPKDILSKIPPELPSFLDNTPASRELRAAYVQHVVSKTLTYRIFHPFLFTLGRRYDKADTFFQLLSMDIRRKSVRREAFWRQQTLKAAYTTSDAKQSINVVAAVIVDEITSHVKHLADPRHLDTLVIDVRKIVKLAAETWRLARVERELILASFPAPDADGTLNDEWDEYGTAKEGCLSSKEDPSRHVILRTFPRIIREAAHEDFTEDKERASPCTYSPGGVLFSDSPMVMARLQELAKKSTDSLNGGEEMPRGGSRCQGSRDSLHNEKCSLEGEPILGGSGEGDQAVKA
ncbi:hypothetical protein EYZ11_009012 [Aspergillus tanneri]|uniref:RNA polymerase Rpb1 C-terminal repeat domain-containing protein n=1 Tax=Aspergillus tanneri TaxID=1220188 RepID=A0A4S3J932_9EURO|nr:uncharacterized protein ATNIH1004_011163 [Aspergillus tanneri]KAA8642222.1 hypothetical protein ATNIH1004_011163 [Aspergillus tanneri]THC91526.1 hypothetical protein EYZ11_009012 [Aspergillus tanneri]